MDKRRSSLRWLFIAVAITAILVFLGYFGLRAGQQYLFARITLREATATVRAKEYVRFDERNHSYSDDHGNRIEVAPGAEQWRVYYQVDNFNMDEPVRSLLMRAEEERATTERLRFEFKSREW